MQQRHAEPRAAVPVPGSRRRSVPWPRWAAYFLAMVEMSAISSCPPGRSTRMASSRARYRCLSDGMLWIRSALVTTSKEPSSNGNAVMSAVCTSTRSATPAAADEQIRQLASTGFSRPGHEIPQEFLDDVRGMTYHSFTAIMLAPRDYLEQRALPDRLKALRRPLQVIFGDQDRRWRTSSAADYRAVPGAKVEWLPGVGHSPMLEDPQRTAALLLAFTGSIVESRSTS
jgi:pimeloyl-ACP methyl ester carboxylesterase